MNTNGISRERQIPMLCQCSKLWTVVYIPKRWNGKLTSVDFLHCSAFSNAFKIILLQKMHNPADHIFPPQWLVKAFQILIAQLPHDPHLNFSAKGSFCSAAQRNSQPSLLQPSEESSNTQANTNCVSPLTNNNDKLSWHLSNPKKLDGSDGGFDFLRITFSGYVNWRYIAISTNQ